MASTSSIPIIDFARASDDAEAIAQEILQACTEWGFFFVKNHTIPQEQIDGMFNLSKTFFAQPDDVKSEAAYDPSKNAGFKPAKIYSASHKADKASDDTTYTAVKDPREAFSMNKWPTETHASSAKLSPTLSSSRPQILSFQESCHSFSLSLLKVLAKALALNPSTFSSLHPRLKENFDNLEIMHYPVLDTTLSLEHKPKHRISPHTDWGTLTLLFQHENVSGLEVRPPQYTSPSLKLAEEDWTPAPAPSDMVLINIGDMLEFLTAGRLKSTWHRVTSEDVLMSKKDRYCIAYFLHPDKGTVLEPMMELATAGQDWTPRYEGRGRTAQEHIMARISGAGLAEKAKDTGLTDLQEKRDESMVTGQTVTVA